jgi:hypothetical protein
MENKNDMCIMLIAYYKEKNNIDFSSKTEKKLYKNLLNTYGNVEELKDVRDIETYLFENNYLLKKRDNTYTVTEIGRNSFKNKRFLSEHNERIWKEWTVIFSILSLAISLVALLRTIKP